MIQQGEDDVTYHTKMSIHFMIAAQTETLEVIFNFCLNNILVRSGCV